MEVSGCDMCHASYTHRAHAPGLRFVLCGLQHQHAGADLSTAWPSACPPDSSTRLCAGSSKQLCASSTARATHRAASPGVITLVPCCQPPVIATPHIFTVTGTHLLPGIELLVPGSGSALGSWGAAASPEGEAVESNGCSMGVGGKGTLQQGWQARGCVAQDGDLVAVQEKLVPVDVAVQEHAVLVVRQLPRQPPAGARQLQLSLRHKSLCPFKRKGPADVC